MTIEKSAEDSSKNPRVGDILRDNTTATTTGFGII